MPRFKKTCATALMLVCMGGNALAAAASSAGCASDEDMSALRAAAVQQRLMVAALSCHAFEHYNKFVLAYQKICRRPTVHCRIFSGAATPRGVSRIITPSKPASPMYRQCRASVTARPTALARKRLSTLHSCPGRVR